MTARQALRIRQRALPHHSGSGTQASLLPAGSGWRHASFAGAGVAALAAGCQAGGLICLLHGLMWEEAGISTPESAD